MLYRTGVKARIVDMNHTVPGCNSQLCPDVVVTDKDHKRSMMIVLPSPSKADGRILQKARSKTVKI